MRFALEYRKTPARAIPVPAPKNKIKTMVEIDLISFHLISLLKFKVKAIPRVLISETGVRKKSTELTITTTRFTQLPTE